MLTNNWLVLRGLHGYPDNAKPDWIAKALASAMFESHINTIRVFLEMAKDSTFLSKALRRRGKQEIIAALTAGSGRPSVYVPAATRGPLPVVAPVGSDDPDPVWMTDEHAKLTSRMARAQEATDKAYTDLITMHSRVMAACEQGGLGKSHRVKDPDWSRVIFPAFVARKVPKAEMAWNPKVKIAIEAELPQQNPN